MKVIKSLLVAGVAAATLGVATDADARGRHGWHGHRWHGHHHHRGHWIGPAIGLSIGVPLLLGSHAWGAPYYWEEPRIVYREVIREPEIVEVEREPAPATTEVPRGQDVPARGPLYMNYCESSKAYFPKVTRCPEGWKFISPTQ